MTQPGQTTRNSLRSALAENLLPSNHSSAMATSSRQPPSPQPSVSVLPETGITPIPEAEEDDDRVDDAVIPKGDNPDPDLDLDSDHSDAPPEHNLARSLELLANKIAKMPASSKPKSTIKPRTPDVFDGTDSSKLETFIFQCSMYMSARAADFPDDESRVTFALSYLKGNPLDWFQTELSDSIDAGDEDLPTWFVHYPEFLTEHKRLFGPRDPITDTMNHLEALRYKDLSKAACYTIDFNRYGRRTGWNEQALTRQFYKGLPERLKDEIARIGKPTGLKPLQDLVATLDQRYWERQAEISRDKRTAPSASTGKPGSTDTRTENRADNRAGFKSASGWKPNNAQHPKNRDQRKPASSAASASSSYSAVKTNTVSDLLGPDGKLKPEERKRRMDNMLCLRCGEAGHTVSNCPHVAKGKPPKGCAATATPATPFSTDAAVASGKA